MVAHPGAPLGAGAMRAVKTRRGSPEDRTVLKRALNGPVPVRVRADADGRPLMVQRRGWPRPRTVACVQDRWRIDDEWWRERPISRLYYMLLLDNGMLLTVYHDLVTDEWFEQSGQ